MTEMIATTEMIEVKADGEARIVAAIHKAIEIATLTVMCIVTSMVEIATAIGAEIETEAMYMMIVEYGRVPDHLWMLDWMHLGTS